LSDAPVATHVRREEPPHSVSLGSPTFEAGRDSTP